MARGLQIGFGATLLALGAVGLGRADTPQAGDPDGHDYQTAARVEYVQECMVRNGGEIAFLYKCSCAIDRIAKDLTYDDFVEMGTLVHNASLGGERAGVFRDSDDVREKAKKYRAIEAAAFKSCGVPPPPK
jgi:hypothetical protein